jgi:hypothetical protein
MNVGRQAVAVHGDLGFACLVWALSSITLTVVTTFTSLGLWNLWATLTAIVTFTFVWAVYTFTVVTTLTALSGRNFRATFTPVITLAFIRTVGTLTAVPTTTTVTSGNIRTALTLCFGAFTHRSHP